VAAGKLRRPAVARDGLYIELVEEFVIRAIRAHAVAEVLAGRQYGLAQARFRSAMRPPGPTPEHPYGVVRDQVGLEHRHRCSG